MTDDKLTCGTCGDTGLIEHRWQVCCGHPPADYPTECCGMPNEMSETASCPDCGEHPQFKGDSK